MTEMTPLDRSHGEMASKPDDDAARLAFYQSLAASELFLMLETEASDQNDHVTPETFDLDGTNYVLVFDREERLSEFAGRITPYVAVSGRTVVGMLAVQEIGLGVNLDVAPSAILLPPAAITWLHDTLGHAPDEVDEAIAAVHPPVGLPEELIAALDGKLATAMGLATSAYLAGVTYASGAKGHLLGFVDAIPEAESALTQAAAEALTFSGIEAGAMDISFFRASDKIVSSLDRHGLRFELPQLQQSVTQGPSAPGMDPSKPSKLK